METRAYPPSGIAADVLALLVVESDELGDLGRAAMERLSKAKKLRSERTVRQESKRFGKSIAADPTCVDVRVLPVVGFAPKEDNADEFEPIVAYEGKLQRITATYMWAHGEYWAGTREEVTTKRKQIVAGLARKIAEDFAFGEALFELIHEANTEDKVTSMSVDARTGTVEIEGDQDHEVAKRLPTWVKIKGLTVGAD